MTRAPVYAAAVGGPAACWAAAWAAPRPGFGPVLAALAAVAVFGCGAYVTRALPATRVLVIDRVLRAAALALISPVYLAALIPLCLRVPARRSAARPADPDASRAIRRLMRVVTDTTAWPELAAGPLGSYLRQRHEHYSDRVVAAARRHAMRVAARRASVSVPLLAALLIGCAISMTVTGGVVIAQLTAFLAVISAPGHGWPFLLPDEGREP